MRVVAVAQAFKETLSADTVANAMATGIRSAGGEPIVLIGSDGGDGLAEALAPRFVRTTRHTVSGPLSERRTVDVGWLGPKSAVIESRLVCGLSLVPQTHRNPLNTSTRGVGELIAQLAETGAAGIYLGLGGSATMDGGLGMARAWGWIPRNHTGAELPEGGQALLALAGLTSGHAPRVTITGLVDVINPLVGPQGAQVYAAQKGASPQQAVLLDNGLKQLAALATAQGKGDLVMYPGAGAAGGLGFGVLFFAGGSLIRGATWVLQQIGFAEALGEADLVICGEGAFDSTSLTGKLTGSVLEAAAASEIPAALLAPSAEGVPHGVLLETGGGRWTAEEIAHRAEVVVKRALRT